MPDHGVQAYYYQENMPDHGGDHWASIQYSISKNSILKDKYLENCFIYKSFKAIFVRRNKKHLSTMGNCEI